MGKSDSAKALDRLASALYCKLKPVGFKRRSRTFNRSISKGWNHVIEFEYFSVPHVPTDKHFILSVGVAEDTLTHVLKKGLRTQRFSDFSSQWDSLIAYTLHRKKGLIAYDRDAGLHYPNVDMDIFWNPLDSHDNNLSSLWTLLQQDGLPFLDSLNTKVKIFEYYCEKYPEKLKHQAVLLFSLGKEDEAFQMLDDISSQESNLADGMRAQVPTAKILLLKPAEEIKQKLIYFKETGKIPL